MNATLREIASPARPPIEGRTLIVVAHPDDEILGFGALLPRLRDLTIAHVADGAGRFDAARAHGFDAPLAYAQARRAELAQALGIAGGGHATLVSLGVPDQGAAQALVRVARALAPFVARADHVLTHAFEGGHPDHDATAFAVQAAAALAGGRPLLIEAPFYRAGPGASWLRQRFAPNETAGAATLRLTAPERARKAQALAAFTTQRATLDGFGAADEAYRLSPAHNFAAPPNGGDVLYERYDWGVSAAGLAALCAAARSELGLSDA